MWDKEDNENVATENRDLHHRRDDPVSVRGGSCIAKALRYNHHGVALLMSGGQDDKAIAILRLGLVHMKSEISSDALPCTSTTATGTTNSTSSVQSSHSNPLLVVAPRPLQVPPPFSVSASTHHHFVKMTSAPVYQSRRAIHDDPVFVYTKAFTFQNTSDDPQSTTICVRHTRTNDEEMEVYVAQQGHSIFNSQIINTEILSATIIYNLALAIHMKAKQGARRNSSSSNTARRALVLYEMCIKFLTPLLAPAATDTSFSVFQEVVGGVDGGAARTTRMTPSPATTMNLPALYLAMVCCNNMAHLVYIQEGDFEKWQVVISSLQCLLDMYCRSSSELCDFESPFLDSDMAGFKWNCMLVTLPITAKAA